jgi:LPXTG-motif cell wall-anchored protein
MFKKVTVIVLFFMLFFTPRVNADEVIKINAKVDGTIEVGQKIKIHINIEEIKSFFAGYAKLKYDKDIIKVIDIEKGKLISRAGIEKFEAMNRIDDVNGIIEYGFSCLGKINGYEGSGTFITINAEILKKEGFHINSEAFLKNVDENFNLRLQICDSDINELKYTFTPFKFETGKAQEGTSGTGNKTGSTGTSSSGSEKATDNSKPSESNPGGTSSSDNTDNKTETTKEPNGDIKQGETTEKGNVNDKNTASNEEKDINTNSEKKERSSNIILLVAGFPVLVAAGVMLFLKKRKNVKLN